LPQGNPGVSNRRGFLTPRRHVRGYDFRRERRDDAFQVPRASLKPLGVIASVTDHAVAVRAEQAANDPGAVVVVYVESSWLLDRADSTATALLREHAAVVCERNTVLPHQVTLPHADMVSLVTRAPFVRVCCSPSSRVCRAARLAMRFESATAILPEVVERLFLAAARAGFHVFDSMYAATTCAASGAQIALP
jgi:hypothetical protein